MNVVEEAEVSILAEVSDPSCEIEVHIERIKEELIE